MNTRRDGWRIVNCSSSKCSCESLYDHIKNYAKENLFGNGVNSNFNQSGCAVKGCDNPKEIVVSVRNVNADTKHERLICVCSEHVNIRKEFEIKDDIFPVPKADVNR